MKDTERILREADEAMLRGDMDGYWGAHADDAVAHIAGKGAISGTYKGLDEIKGLFDKMMSTVDSFAFESHDYLGSDEHAIALQRTKWTRGEKTFDSDDIFIFHFRDGKISEFWMSSLQQQDLDAFLS